MARALSVWLAGFMLALSAACGASQPTTLPEEFLGRWYYVGSSGGITGRGMGDEALGYLVIHADNSLDQHDEAGRRVDATKITVRRGPTIFSTEEQWLVIRADETPETSAEVIVLSEDGRTMSLSENVYDGFVRSYARSR